MKAMMIITGSVLLLSVGAASAQSENGSGTDSKETKSDVRKNNSSHKQTQETYQANQAFTRDFNDVKDATWKESPLFEEATFDENGVAVTAYYDFDSELVGTTTEKTFDNIPMRAKEFIQKHYAGYTPLQVILFHDNETNDTDMELFNKAFEDEDNYFVSMKNSKETVVLKVGLDGSTEFFRKL